MSLKFELDKFAIEPLLRLLNTCSKDELTVATTHSRARDSKRNMD